MLLVVYPSESATRKDEVAWIVNRTRTNIAESVQTSVVSVYHTITSSDLSDLLADRLVVYADIVHDVPSGLRSERIFEIGDGLLDISLFLSGLIDSAGKARIPLDVIFHNFSGLIHNLGDEDMFRLITYKAAKLDERTNLILFIYPRSHAERVWEKFKAQAHEVIKIEGHHI